MKNKILRSLSIILLILLCVVISGCKDDKLDTPDVPDEPSNVILPVGLDLEGYKSEYEVGEEFSSSNLKATLVNQDGTKEDVSASVTINSEKYNKDADGTYEIIVSYIKNNITVKNFYFAVVGTGISQGGGSSDNEDKVFGPGTYELKAVEALLNYAETASILNNTSFVDGFYIVKGSGAKRANSSTYAFELPKNEEAWIEFDVIGTATVTLVVSSTGGTNTSAIAIYDGENSVVANAENLTAVTGTSQVTLTYTLTSGTYRILSQSGTTHSTRGVRVYSVKVVQ